MSEEMNKEAEVQEEAVDIPVTDGSEEEAADTAQTAEEEASEETDASEDAEDDEDSMEEPVDSQEIVRKRRPEFKMINLSREPEPTGIDDDFEFEFIHFEDD